MTNGDKLDVRADAVSFRRLVGWWQAATPEERFRLLKASIEGQTEAPPLDALRFAAVVAEIEAGEIAEG